MSLMRTSAARLMLLGILAVAASGQTRNTPQRLREALARYGEGELAAQKLANRDFAAVAEMLDKRAALNAGDRTELLSLEGSVAFLAGEMSAAVLHFEKAAELAPLQDGDAFTLAMALVSLGNDERAAEMLSRLSHKYPKQSIYLYWLGRLDYDRRRYPEAIVKLQEAVELDPKSARAWDSLGLALDMQGQMEQAYGAFTKAVDLNRTSPHPSAWPPHDLGYWCLRMNRLGEAVSALREALRYDPKLAQAHYHLARALEKEARKEQAILEYQNAISEDTSSADACYSLAMLYRRMHQDEEARAMFTEYRKRKEAQPVSGAARPVERR